MGLIPVLFFFLALLGCFKGLSVEAYFDQSCQLSPELEQECSVYAHQVTKPMLGYFEQVTQKIDKHSEEIERRNEQIKLLEEKEMKIQMELNIKNEQNKQLGENIMKLQMENMNYKLKETGILEDLKQKMDQLQNNLCESEKKEFKANEIELHRELQSKNEQIRQLGENMTKLHNSMAAVQEELRKQLGLNVELQKNLAQIKDKLSSEGERLTKCKTELESKRNELVEIDKEKTKQQTELRKLADKLEKRNRASCITQGSSGVHTVTLSNNDTFEVLCNSDIAGPGWTVIQQRIRGGVDFNVKWNTYRNGFGDFWDGDFFLGLEKIHRLTAEQPHELYIQITRFNGSTFFARYDEFAISGEEDKYRLTKLGRFFGDTSDEFSYHKGMRFSTIDQDNDVYDGDCARYLEGAWWYKNCARARLNGIYYASNNYNGDGIVWEGTLVKHARMMIRPKMNCI